MEIYGIKHPDGTRMYMLPKPDTGEIGIGHILKEILADGQPMTQLNRKGWWATDHDAKKIVAVYKTPSKRLHYKLDDMSALSVKFPVILSVDEYDGRSVREDAVCNLYSGVYEDQADMEYLYGGPYRLMEGREPPGPGEPRWVAQLPHELKERPEYRHLFPGHIPGLRDHLYETIKTMPDVQFCFNEHHHLEVTLRVSFDPPQYGWKAYTGVRGQALKSGRNVQKFDTRRLVLPVPAIVNAPNYEAALITWNEAVKYWTGIVESAKVKACGHCGGTGHVVDGSERFEKPKEG